MKIIEMGEEADEHGMISIEVELTDEEKLVFQKLADQDGVTIEQAISNALIHYVESLGEDNGK